MSDNDLYGADSPEADLTEATIRDTVVKSAQPENPMTDNNVHLS